MCARVRVGRAVGEAGVAAGDLAAAEAERRDAAAARRVEDDLAALALVLGRGAQAGAQDLRVERAGEAAVARDEEDRDPVLVLVLAAGSAARDLAARGLGGLARHAPDRARVRAQRGDALLGAPQARGGDHLHRPRDLADVLDGVDPLLDVALGGHGLGGCAAASCGLGVLLGLARRPSAVVAVDGWSAAGPPARASLVASSAAGPPRRGRSRSRRRSSRRLAQASCVSSDQSPSAIFAEQVLVLGVQAVAAAGSRKSGTRSVLMRSRKPFVAAKTARPGPRRSAGERSFWLSVATRRSPRASVRWVSASRSEPNWANASRSRYWESSSFRRPATFFIGADLRVAAHARHRDADVDGRAHAREEELRLEEDLPVGDRDDVRRDVRRHVAGLRLDDRQRGQRAAAEVVVELDGALEQAASAGRRRRPGTPRGPAGGAAAATSAGRRRRAW